MVEERNLQLIVRVLTISGQNLDHRYLLPSDDKEAAEFVEKLAEMMKRTMSPKTSALVWFDNPLIVYNPDNILGIRTDLVGSEQEKRAIGAQVKTKLGLTL